MFIIIMKKMMMMANSCLEAMSQLPSIPSITSLMIGQCDRCGGVIIPTHTSQMRKLGREGT